MCRAQGPQRSDAGDTRRTDNGHGTWYKCKELHALRGFSGPPMRL